MPIVSALGDPVSGGSHVDVANLLPGLTQPWVWAPGVAPQQAWRDWASQTSAWLQAQGVEARDACVVLPVGAVLSQARQAWAQAVGGWLPRIDTIAGLIDGLAWSHTPPVWGGALAEVFAGPVTLDSVWDRLHARHSLQAQAWAKQWSRRDPRGFEFALDQVVDAAQAWTRALQGCAPEARSARVEAWRALMSEAQGQGGASHGPGHREALLLAWALEWAAASAQQGFASDAVFACAVDRAGPAAWVAVNAGDTVAPGSEGALTLAVLAHAAAHGKPVRRVVARPSALAPADAVDGAMARTKRKITTWGTLYDPIADKLLIGAVSVIVVTKYIDAYLALAIIVIEILLVSFAYLRYKGKIVPAKTMGKTKMILQCLGIAVLLLYVVLKIPILLTVATYTLYTAVLFGLLSLFIFRSI